MRRIALLVVFAAAPLFAALPDDELRRGLLNLIYLEDLSFRLQYERAVRGTLTAPLPVPADPWGTPYRVEIDGAKFRIIGAGSDRTFDSSTWSADGQFADLTIDVVVDDGKTIRSNYTWLNRMVPDRLEQQDAVARAFAANPERPLDAVLSTPRLAAGYLLSVESNAILLRNPRTVDLLRAERTRMTMVDLAKRLAEDRRRAVPPADEWDTSLRVETGKLGGYRIISAGADRKFDPQSWPLPMKLDANDDQVYDSARGFVRKLDRAAYVRQLLAEKNAAAPPQPAAMRTIERGGVHAYLVGGDVKPPVVVKRVDPVYPEAMRKEKKLALTVVEVTLDETGKLRDTTILLSRGEEFDQAVKDALAKHVFQPGTLNGKAVPVIYTMTMQVNPEG